MLQGCSQDLLLVEVITCTWLCSCHRSSARWVKHGKIMNREFVHSLEFRSPISGEGMVYEVVLYTLYHPTNDPSCRVSSGLGAS